MKQSIMTDTIAMTISRVISITLSLITSMLLARFRTLDEYGTYSQLLLVLNIVDSILMLGLPYSINFFLAKSDSAEEKRYFMSVYYTISGILSFIVGFVLIVSTPFFVGYFKNPVITSLWYFMVLYPWTSSVINSASNFLIVYRRTPILMLFNISYSFTVLFSIIVIKFLNLSFSYYMVTTILISVLFSFVVYFIANRVIGKLKFSVDLSLLKSILIFTIPLGLASFIGSINIELDKLLISYLYATRDYAIYSMVSKELPVTIIASSFTAVLLPRFVTLLHNQRYEDAIAIWGDSVVLSFSLLCLLATGIIVYAEDVVLLLFSEKYLPGVNVFRVYALLLLLRCTYFGIILNSSGKSKFIFYSSVASVALNIILNFTFISLFGFIGPAIATIVAVMLISLIQLLWSSEILKMKISRIFPWKSLFFILIVNVLFGSVFFVIKIISPLNIYFGSIGESIVLGLMWSLMYFYILRKRLKNCWYNMNGVD
jgi:O-antigen/teichoic acid export membrane protein